VNGKIAIIGLGYVGLPLAVEFGKKRDVIGFDIKPDRIAELRDHHDATLEVSAEEYAQTTRSNAPQKSVRNRGRSPQKR